MIWKGHFFWSLEQQAMVALRYHRENSIDCLKYLCIPSSKLVDCLEYKIDSIPIWTNTAFVQFWKINTRTHSGQIVYKSKCSPTKNGQRFFEFDCIQLFITLIHFSIEYGLHLRTPLFIFSFFLFIWSKTVHFSQPSEADKFPSLLTHWSSMCAVEWWVLMMMMKQQQQQQRQHHCHYVCKF